jgi:hypothetical protein
MRIGSGWVSTILQRLLLRLWHDDEVAARVDAAASRYEHRRRGLLNALLSAAIAAAAQPSVVGSASR